MIRRRSTYWLLGGLAGTAHGHGLDETQGETVLCAELQELLDLPVVDPRHDHGVDADRLESRPAGRRETAQHLIEPPPGHLREDLRPQTVQAGIQAPHAGLIEGFGQGVHPGAVAGQGQIVQARQYRQARGQPRQIAPHQGLTAGQAHMADAQPGEGAHHAGDLVEIEPVLGFLEALKALGQAVTAAQVAAVGHGETQIGDLAAEWVGQWLGRHGAGLFIVLPLDRLSADQVETLRTGRMPRPTLGGEHQVIRNRRRLNDTVRL